MGTRDDVAAALGEIDSEIAEAEERLETLRLERRGAEVLLRRLRPVPVPANSAQKSPSVTGRGGIGNTAIVADILSKYPAGLHLRQIEDKTAEWNAKLDNEQVRGAVTYLKRIKRAERAARGVWRLLPTDAESASEAPKADSVVPDLGPEGGDADETGLDDHRHDLERRNGGHPTGTPIMR